MLGKGLVNYEKNSKHSELIRKKNVWGELHHQYIEKFLYENKNMLGLGMIWGKKNGEFTINESMIGSSTIKNACPMASQNIYIYI